jgi:hypothetical protein
MTTDRKKPGVAFWATVVLVVVLAYPLSFGPIVWLAQHEWLTGWALDAAKVFYFPIDPWFHDHGPQPLKDGMEWYVEFWDE